MISTFVGLFDDKSTDPKIFIRLPADISLNPVINQEVED
jgi:hypothetical protein